MPIFASTGSPQAISSASGGKVWPFNAISDLINIQVLAINPQRQRITFMNPGTQKIYVSPMTTATGATLTPTLANLGGTFSIVPDGMLVIEGECQQAWQARAAAGGATNPLTVMESNI